MSELDEGRPSAADRGPASGAGTRGGTDPAWPSPPAGWRHDAPGPPDAFPVPFGVADAAMLVGWSVFAQVLVALSLATAGVQLDAGPSQVLVVMAIYVLVSAGALAWLAARGSLSWRLLGPVRPAWRHAAIGLGIGVAGYLIVFTLLLAALRIFGPVDQDPQQLLDATTSGGVTTILAVLVAVVFAPVVEEVIYRGVLFQALRRRLGLWPGIVISSIVFAILHAEVQEPIYSAALAVLAAWLAATFHRTGSLVVPILGHATFNAIMVALALAAGTA